MSLNPYWHLLGLLLFITVFVLIHKSSRYAEEDVSPDKDFYHRGGNEIYPLSMLENYIEDMEEQRMPITKINVQQYLTPNQRNEFYINSMKVEAKGATTHASNDKRSDGRTNANSFNRILSGFSAKG